MEENHFKQLRFKDKYCLQRIMTIDEMAELTGLRKSTISKIERNNVDNINVSTLRAYHDNLKNVSYEFLMGNTKNREKKYYTLGELFPFDDNFYNNLTKLLEMDNNNESLVCMLSAFLDNPEELFHVMTTTFNSLYSIYQIQQNKELPAPTKTKFIKMEEYVFNQTIITFLENQLMPLLHSAFELHNTELTQQANQTQELLYDCPTEIYEAKTTKKVYKAIPKKKTT